LIKVAKPLVFLLCLVPFGLLVWGAFTNNLGTNQVETVTHRTGEWTLRFLMITLAITPLRKLTGWNWLARFRRMMGLFSFFYAILHFTIYVLSIQAFNWAEISVDITMRPYITVGFLSFLFMIPLAITSTKGWIKRLGGKRWQLLHRLVYLSAIGGVLHYLWLKKLPFLALLQEFADPVRYGVVLAVLLLFRVWTAVRTRTQPTGGSNALSGNLD
jgi:sulfoxide reductase heme-binding subunit YedZ